MDHARFFIQAAAEIAPDARRVRIECIHGRTFGLVLAKGRALPDPIALDMLAIQHGSAYRCGCSAVLRPGAAEVWSESAASIVSSPPSPPL